MSQKIISWNVNGIRAIMRKDFITSLQALRPDILCLQETKANVQQVKEALSMAEGYHIYANASKESKGYSGTAILSKTPPLNVYEDINKPEHDKEGRVITAEYEHFFVVNVYVPNSGSGLVRLDYRTQWDQDFREWLKKLEETKPVIVCGDFNVAHQPIDIARPKDNYNKSAGYTQKEIDGFNQLQESGLIDTFRYFNPDTVKYSWWSYRANARAKNIGWRIDYVLTSQSLISKVQETFILNEYFGSDHCPLGITLLTTNS